MLHLVLIMPLLSMIFFSRVKFSIIDFFTKCDQIHIKLRIWSNLLKKSIIENFIFCAVLKPTIRHQKRFMQSVHYFRKKFHLRSLTRKYFRPVITMKTYKDMPLKFFKNTMKKGSRNSFIYNKLFMLTFALTCLYDKSCIQYFIVPRRLTKSLSRLIQFLILSTNLLTTFMPQAS